jgi:hypothetical protein
LRKCWPGKSPASKWAKAALHKLGSNVYTACINTLLQGACEERRKDGTMFIARMVAVL